MAAYYNEIDPYCVGWLRNLIAAKLIAPGDVDDRSIQDVRPVDLQGYAQCHFFAGIGGWSFALRLAGWGDHREVWTGSCPCQPFSAAGKRGGFADERHLWPFWQYLIEQRRPPVVFGEQVASAAEWLRLVRGDLEALDYAVGTMSIEAASAGADHLRDRYWFVADRASERRDGTGDSGARRRDEYSNGGLADDGGRRRDGSREGEIKQPRRAEAVGAGNSNGMAHGHGQGLEERVGNGRVQREAMGAPERQAAERDGVADSKLARSFPSAHPGIYRGEESAGTRHVDAERRGEFDWVLGADGKARRVKPGVRLLVDGFPNRIPILRALGNAIDPRPASAFIAAYMECRP